MKIFDDNNNYVGSITGVYNYSSSAIYTEGDIVIVDTDERKDIYVCIRDLPSANAILYFDNPDYFRPFWYLYAIRDFDTYVRSISPNDAERPVLKRVLDAVMERKFGTGLLVADQTLYGERLDLNNIVHTGRYIIYVIDYTSIMNLPAYMLNAVSANPVGTYVSQVLGLDVYATASDNSNSPIGVVQVVFSNNNNNVTVAVRSGTLGANGTSWSQWQMLRSSINLRMVNDYLEIHRDLVESLYDASRKQSFLVKLRYAINGEDLRVFIPIPVHNIFRQMVALMILARGKETLSHILISDFIPMILYHADSSGNAQIPNNLVVRYNGEPFSVSVQSNAQQPYIQINGFYSKYEPLRVCAVT